MRLSYETIAYLASIGDTEAFDAWVYLRSWAKGDPDREPYAMTHDGSKVLQCQRNFTAAL